MRPFFEFLVLLLLLFTQFSNGWDQIVTPSFKEIFPKISDDKVWTLTFHVNRQKSTEAAKKYLNDWLDENWPNSPESGNFTDSGNVTSSEFTSSEIIEISHSGEDMDYEVIDDGSGSGDYEIIYESSGDSGASGDSEDVNDGSGNYRDSEDVDYSGDYEDYENSGILDSDDVDYSGASVNKDGSGNFKFESSGNSGVSEDYYDYSGGSEGSGDSESSGNFEYEPSGESEDADYSGDSWNFDIDFDFSGDYEDGSGSGDYVDYFAPKKFGDQIQDSKSPTTSSNNLGKVLKNPKNRGTGNFNENSVSNAGQILADPTSELKKYRTRPTFDVGMKIKDSGDSEDNDGSGNVKLESSGDSGDSEGSEGSGDSESSGNFEYEHSGDSEDYDGSEKELSIKDIDAMFGVSNSKFNKSSPTGIQEPWKLGTGEGIYDNSGYNSDLYRAEERKISAKNKKSQTPPTSDVDLEFEDSGDTNDSEDFENFIIECYFPPNLEPDPRYASENVQRSKRLTADEIWQQKWEAEWFKYDTTTPPPWKSRCLSDKEYARSQALAFLDHRDTLKMYIRYIFKMGQMDGLITKAEAEKMREIFWKNDKYYKNKFSRAEYGFVTEVVNDHEWNATPWKIRESLKTYAAHWDRFPPIAEKLNWRLTEDYLCWYDNSKIRG